MTREERRIAAQPYLNFIKPIAASIGQFVYEFDGELYPHYVDERDACAPWCPLRSMSIAMQVAMHHSFWLAIDNAAEDGMAVAVTTATGEVLAMQEGPAMDQRIVMRAICLAAAKVSGHSTEYLDGR